MTTPQTIYSLKFELLSRDERDALAELVEEAFGFQGIRGHYQPGCRKKNLPSKTRLGRLILLAMPHGRTYTNQDLHVVATHHHYSLGSVGHMLVLLAEEGVVKKLEKGLWTRTPEQVSAKEFSYAR